MDTELHDIENRIVAVSTELRESMLALLHLAVGRDLQPRNVCSVFAISRQLASKLLLAIRRDDAMTSAYFMPGHEALLQVLESTPAKYASTEAYKHAKRAIENFEFIIEQEIGGRANFECIVSGRVEEARLQTEMRGRQLAFRGRSMIHGSMFDTVISTRVLGLPDDESARCRSAVLTAWLGIRRLRADMSEVLIEAGSKEMFTIKGTSVYDDPASAMIHEYCSRPLPRVEFSSRADATEFRVVSSNPIGMKSPADLCWAVFKKPHIPTSQDHPFLHQSLSAIVFGPAKRLVFDTYIPLCIWPGNDPKLVVRDMSYGDTRVFDEFPNGIPDDIVNTSDSIQHLGQGLANTHLLEAPWYSELVERACTALSVRPQEMRGYRLIVDYPLHAANHHMLFKRR